MYVENREEYFSVFLEAAIAEDASADLEGSVGGDG